MSPKKAAKFSELLSVQSSDDGVWNKVEDGAVNEDWVSWMDADEDLTGHVTGQTETTEKLTCQ